MRPRKDQVNHEAAEATVPLDNPTFAAHNSNASDVPVEGMDWQPQAGLTTPPPPAGWWYTWVRTHIGEEPDGRNYVNMYRQGYRPVLSSELEDFYVPSTSLNVQHAEGKPVVAVKDMVLMKIPLRMKLQRDKYYADMARKQVREVDRRLHAESKRPGDKFMVDRKSSTELRKAPLDEETED